MYYLVREKYTKTTDATDLEVIGWAETDGIVTDWLQVHTKSRPFSAAFMRDARSGTHAIKINARDYVAEVRSYDPSLCVPPPGWVDNPSEVDFAERLLQEHALRSVIVGGHFLRDPNSGVLFAA